MPGSVLKEESFEDDSKMKPACSIQAEPLSRLTESNCSLWQQDLFAAWLEILIERMAQHGTFELLLCLTARQDMLVRSQGFAEERCFRWEDDLLFLFPDSSSRQSV